MATERPLRLQQHAGLLKVRRRVHSRGAASTLTALRYNGGTARFVDAPRTSAPRSPPPQSAGRARGGVPRPVARFGSVDDDGPDEVRGSSVRPAKRVTRLTRKRLARPRDASACVPVSYPSARLSDLERRTLRNAIKQHSHSNTCVTKHHAHTATQTSRSAARLSLREHASVQPWVSTAEPQHRTRT